MVAQYWVSHNTGSQNKWWHMAIHGHDTLQHGAYPGVNKHWYRKLMCLSCGEKGHLYDSPMYVYNCIYIHIVDVPDMYIYIIRCCFWPKYKTIHCGFFISVLIYVLSFQNMQRHNLFTNHLPCFLPEDSGHMRVMTTLDHRPDADHGQVRHFIPSVSRISMVPCWFAVSSSCGSKLECSLASFSLKWSQWHWNDLNVIELLV